jgi:hypothetical protein
VAVAAVVVGLVVVVVFFFGRCRKFVTLTVVVVLNSSIHPPS